MGALEPASSGEGYETDSSSSNKVESVLANTMRRATSVDDLFAPLWSLNVHARQADSPHQSSSSIPPGRPPSDPSAQSRNASSLAAAAHSSAVPVTTQMAAPTVVRVASGSGQPSSAALVAVMDRRGVSSSATEAQGQTSRETRIDSLSEAGSERASGAAGGARGSSSSRSSSQFSELDGTDARPSFLSFEPESILTFTAGTRGTGKSSSGGGGTDAALPPSQSTSDDDQVNGGLDGCLDERKQKRMLSNRESARRSRLRKQQHLDELRAQVARLRAENSDMLTKFGVASQRYSQLTGENLVLRTHAMDLSRKLQQLHHTVATQHPNGLHALGIQTGHLDPVPLGSFSSVQHHLSPYSQPLVPDLMH